MAPFKAPTDKDDAGVVPDFVEQLEAYVLELPEDWGLAYLGGQHLYDAKNADHSDAPFFAVLGPHRSGTSYVALVMHHLGVHMGMLLSRMAQSNVYFLVGDQSDGL